ncbi:hypothetical protein [Caudoviricetes sp.]|nr:hypothetical protein [Caudoviricetes sp.]
MSFIPRIYLEPLENYSNIGIITSCIRATVS